MYDPEKKFDELKNSPEFQAQMKRMSTREGVAEGKKTMSRAAKGHEKYGKEGMQALAKAGREGKDLEKIRAKYNRYDESIAEGSEITEEMIADRLKNELALFKSGTKAKNKSISGKPADRGVQPKKSPKKDSE
jgi:hypothetical protein